MIRRNKRLKLLKVNNVYVNDIYNNIEFCSFVCQWCRKQRRKQRLNIPHLEPVAHGTASQQRPRRWRWRTRTPPSCSLCPAPHGCSAPGNHPEHPRLPRQHSDSLRSGQTLKRQMWSGTTQLRVNHIFTLKHNI